MKIKQISKPIYRFFFFFFCYIFYIKIKTLWEAVAVTVAKAIKRYAYNACVISMGYSAHGGK